MPHVFADDDPPPVAPTPPAADACCERGCDPCVLDLYAAALARYEADLRAWQERHPRPPQKMPRRKSSPG